MPMIEAVAVPVMSVVGAGVLSELLVASVPKFQSVTTDACADTHAKSATAAKVDDAGIFFGKAGFIGMGVLLSLSPKICARARAVRVQARLLRVIGVKLPIAFGTAVTAI
jgi:hypothetical protein